LQGSTDGIGKELAKQLAKKGFNIVLVGRSAPKLTAAKAEVIIDLHTHDVSMARCCW
jgi:short-subunit dehydrogenase